MLPDPTIFQYPANPVFLERVILPWTAPPLSLNDSAPASKGAVYARAAKKREVQEAVKLLARNVKMPTGCAYVVAQLNYRPADNRRRDTDNLIASGKHIFDALAGGSKKIPGLGIVADDVPRMMGKPEPIIWPAKSGTKGCIWLDIFAFPGPPVPYGDVRKQT